MSRKCCPACLGIGSYIGTEWIRDDSGVSMFKTVTIRKSCEICGGSGRILEPGYHRHFCIPCGVPFARRRRDGESGEIFDRLSIYLILLALAGYVSFQLFSVSSGMGWWIKIAAALSATGVLWFVLTSPAGTTRVTRRPTLLLVLAAVCGGLAFEFIRR